MRTTFSAAADLALSGLRLLSELPLGRSSLRDGHSQEGGRNLCAVAAAAAILCSEQGFQLALQGCLPAVLRGHVASVALPELDIQETRLLGTTLTGFNQVARNIDTEHISSKRCRWNRGRTEAV